MAWMQYDCYYLLDLMHHQIEHNNYEKGILKLLTSSGLLYFEYTISSVAALLFY
jgi:hypothetical protein